ncbi:putative holin-like toxin [Brevibacillus migulae]
MELFSKRNEPHLHFGCGSKALTLMISFASLIVLVLSFHKKK